MESIFFFYLQKYSEKWNLNGLHIVRFLEYRMNNKFRTIAFYYCCSSLSAKNMWEICTLHTRLFTFNDYTLHLSKLKFPRSSNNSTHTCKYTCMNGIILKMQNVRQTPCTKVGLLIPLKLITLCSDSTVVYCMLHLATIIPILHLRPFWHFYSIQLSFHRVVLSYSIR